MVSTKQGSKKGKKSKVEVKGIELGNAPMPTMFHDDDKGRPVKPKGGKSMFKPKFKKLPRR